MNYLSIKNLEKYQPHFKDGRNNLWIRWNISAMRDYKISQLPDNVKWLFVALICLAVENENQIPDDPKWIANQIGSQNNHICKSLQMLQAFELVVTTLSKVCNNTFENPSPTIQTIQTDNTNNTVVFSFDEIFNKYPNRVGKKEALRHFEATVKTEKDFEDIKTALNNYMESERVKKGFIQNAKTWFNDWQSWVKAADKPEAKCQPADPNCKICQGTGWAYIPATNSNKKCDCTRLK